MSALGVSESCHFIFSSHSPTWAGGGSSSTGGYTLGLVEALPVILQEIELLLGQQDSIH